MIDELIKLKNEKKNLRFFRSEKSHEFVNTYFMTNLVIPVTAGFY